MRIYFACDQSFTPVTKFFESPVDCECALHKHVIKKYGRETLWQDHSEAIKSSSKSKRLILAKKKFGTDLIFYIVGETIIPKKKY